MNAILSIALFAIVTSLVLAQGGGGPGNPGRRGPPGGGGPRGRGPPGGPRGKGHGGPPGMHGMFHMFKECEDFSSDMSKIFEEMRRNNEIGPHNCQSGNHEECMKNDAMAVRCKATVQPSPACVQQVTEFLTNPCPSGGGTESEVTQ